MIQYPLYLELPIVSHHDDLHKADPPHGLQYVFRLLCSQKDDPLQSRHSNFRLLCSQKAEPLQSRHIDFCLLC